MITSRSGTHWANHETITTHAEASLNVSFYLSLSLSLSLFFVFFLFFSFLFSCFLLCVHFPLSEWPLAAYCSAPTSRHCYIRFRVGLLISAPLKLNSPAITDGFQPLFPPPRPLFGHSSVLLHRFCPRILLLMDFFLSKTALCLRFVADFNHSAQRWPFV